MQKRNREREENNKRKPIYQREFEIYLINSICKFIFYNNTIEKRNGFETLRNGKIIKRERERH